MRDHFPFTLIAVLLAVSLGGADPRPSGGSDLAGPRAVGDSLDGLWQSPVRGQRRRASSWDRTGGNQDRFLVRPGQRATLLDHHGGSGSIRRMWFTLKSADPQYLATTKLRFRFDGQTTVDDVPVGMLLATGPWRVNDVVSPVVNVMRSRRSNRDEPGTGAGSFNLLWPMPFASSAAIEALNDSTQEFTIHYYVDYELGSVGPRPLWFYATHRRKHFTTPSKPGEKDITGRNDYVFADVKNAEGRYVGTVLAVESHPSRPGKWYEGDDRFWIDGRTLLHGTGTEDYFGMAWGFHRPYQGYDHGLSHYQRNLTKKDRFFDGRFVAYHWHLGDPIAFAESLRASIEAGHANECAQYYESLAIWYGRPRQ